MKRPSLQKPLHPIELRYFHETGSNAKNPVLEEIQLHKISMIASIIC
jgi:hypothetical protein